MKLRILNKNSVIFMFVSGFLVLSLLPIFVTESFFWLIMDNTVLLRDGKESLAVFAANIESGVMDNLTRSGEMIDLNSLVLRATGTTVISRENYSVLVTDSGMLMEDREYVSDEEIKQYAENVSALYAATQEIGASFLYVAVPGKGYEEEYPNDVVNFETANYDRMTQALQERNIPLLNLWEEMASEGLPDTEIYYATDHHWKTFAGFWAFGKICERMHDDYNFEYDAFFTAIDNYDTVVYEDAFLGSLGKKAGRWFAPHGVEDLTLIIPGFTTDLFEERPFEGEFRSGSFSETVFYTEILEQKNFHLKDPYYVYLRGNYRLQIFKNNLQHEGKRILLIRDSYACTVMPYLALVSSEIHSSDLRRYLIYDFNVVEYMRELRPDYVIVLYNSVYPADDRFDFG